MIRCAHRRPQMSVHLAFDPVLRTRHLTLSDCREVCDPAAISCRPQQTERAIKELLPCYRPAKRTRDVRSFQATAVRVTQAVTRPGALPSHAAMHMRGLP